MKPIVANQAVLNLITSSPLFDATWYQQRYPDVGLSGMSPAMHYLLIGCRLQRDPGPEFSCARYLIEQPQARGPGAFLHFLTSSNGILVPEQDANSHTNTNATTVEPVASIEQLLTEPVPAGPVSGDINSAGGADTVIRGWLGCFGDTNHRIAQIRVAGQVLAEVAASTFRDDLLANGVNQGNHAFEVMVPLALVDGEPRQVDLYDLLSGQLIKSVTLSWQIPRHFKDFDGFLAYSFTNPYFRAPFREEDKACFAVMENIAMWLAAKATSLSEAPLVTVIMPCYNRMDTIAEAVASVLVQHYHNFELILIDDASTDGTLQWCQQQTDPRIRVIAQPVNGGASAARNAGVQQARGQYLMYLDSDNSWDPRYIAAMVGAFMQLPDADALYSGQLMYQGQASEPSAVRFGSFNKSLLFNNNYIDMNAFCHTRVSMQQQGGFDPQFKRFEDWDLFLHYADQGRMYSVPVLLSNYYLFKTGNSLTAEHKYQGQMLEVRKKHSYPLPDLPQAEVYRVQDPVANFAPLSRKVAVIIPSYQALDDLQQCIDSLLALNLGPLLQIIVVDNASQQPVVDYILQQSAEGRILAICNQQNYGFTYAVNQGAALADADADILLLNNDALVMPGALEALQYSAWQLPQCAMVVPQQVLPGGTETITTHVPYANPAFACDVNLSMHHANLVNPPLFHDGGVTEIRFAAFFCVYIRRDAYNLAGPLDAQYGRHYRSDRIYCDLLRNVFGLKIYHQPASLVYHKLQRSTQTLQKAGQKTGEFELMFRKNQWDKASQQQLGFVTARWDI